MNGSAAALEVPSNNNPAGAAKPAPAEKPAPDPAPSTTRAPSTTPAPSTTTAPATAAPPAAGPDAAGASAAPQTRPGTREEQRSVYRDFRAAFDAGRFADARPLAERCVEITDQLDGRDSMALVTPLNNLAQTVYQLKDYSAAEESYLRSIKIIETRSPHSPRLPHTLFGLGRVYVAAGQWEFAITMFRRAVEITRKSDGLFSTTQLPYLLPLVDAYAAAGHVPDEDREEQYLLSIAERNYSPQSAEYIAAVMRQAAWQERQFRFVTARRLYSQAVELIRRAGDVRDVRQVSPLRGIARCYRSEFLYGAADAPEKEPTISEGFDMGQSPLLEPQHRLEPDGEQLLQTALNLLQNANGPAGTRMKRDTMIDLGDWHWVGGDQKAALQNYATAWDLLTTAERASTGPDNPLAQPYLLVYTAPRIASRNPKAKPEDIVEKFVQMQFPVNAQGKAGDIKVTNSDASESQQKSVIAALHRALYRPRFVDRKPAPTDAVTFRETVYEKR